MIIFQPQVLPSTDIGQAYSQKIDVNGGQGPYTFAITGIGTLPPGLTLDPNGVISGTPLKDGIFNFNVNVIDANGCKGNQVYSLKVTKSCPIIDFLLKATPDAVIGLFYTEKIIADGGKGPYQFRIWWRGALPPGLTLAQDGTISGIPTKGGDYDFLVEAIDAENCVGVKSYHISVNCPVISFTVAALPDASIGVMYSQMLGAMGGNAPYVFQIDPSAPGGLPPGLTLNANGLISGQAFVIGVYQFTVVVTDAFGCNTSNVYSITVNSSVWNGEDSSMTGTGSSSSSTAGSATSVSGASMTSGTSLWSQPSESSATGTGSGSSSSVTGSSATSVSGASMTSGTSEASGN